jgi:hypothetical protein
MRLLHLLLLAAALAISPSANALEEEGTANYAYAVFVGTGKYRIGDRSIYVLRAPLAFVLKDPDFETRQIGYKLLVPAAVGLTDFDTIDELPDLRVGDVQTGSVVPGLEAQIPVRENWLIKPFGQAGLGWDMKNSDNSFVWGAGSRTRAWFGSNEKWLIGGELLWAGNHPKREDEPNTSFSRWSVGTEYKLQTNWRPFGHRVSFHGRLIGWWYKDVVEFLAPPKESEIRRTTEVGLSFGINPPINMLGYKFRQGGIGYEFSDELKAVKLFTTFPF